MFCKFIICTLSLVAFTYSQSYQSNKYPADVHPSLCPNYPYCDNTVLAKFSQGAAAFHQATVPGYPAFLSPHTCPNYPYCSHQIPIEAINYRRSAPAYQFGDASVQNPSYFIPHALPSAVGSTTKYPAGVNPASCMNYPYCY